MKTVISGAGGFLGRALCKRLLGNGEDVRMIPRDMLSNSFQLKQYLENEKPDYIIHLAAYGNYHDQTDLRKIYSVNLDNLINLLEASKDVNYRQFINFSSSSVLGVQLNSMWHGSFPNPDTYYASSKLAGESLCKVFSELNNKSIINLRPFSITGVGEQDNHLIPTLIKNGLSGDKVMLDPYPTHDFIDIEDLIDLVSKICSSKLGHQGELIHAGTGLSTINFQVLEIVEKVIGKKIEYDRVTGMRSYDKGNWFCAYSEIVRNENLYSWQPKKSLEQSIKEMYEAITQTNT